MNRKFKPIFILLILALLASACGGGGDKKEESTTPPTQKPTEAPPTKVEPTAEPSPEPAGESPEELGKEIGTVYVEVLTSVIDLVRDKPPADEVKPQVAALKETYIQKLVELGWKREALDEQGKAAADLQIRLALDAFYSGDQERWNAFTEAQSHYAQEDFELNQLLVSFNIIGQYASFELLKKQEPEEAVRLGIMEPGQAEAPAPTATTPPLEPPASALALGAEAFRSQAGGFAIHYPEGWQALEVEGAVMFFESEAALAGDVPSVPVVLIEVGSLQILSEGRMAGAQDAREMLEFLAEAHRAEGEEFTSSELREMRVGDETAVYGDVSRSVEGVPVTSRVVTIHRGDWGILIQTMGTVEAWEEFVSTFEAMMASLSLFEVAVPTPALGSISVRPADGMVMVYVPAGEFLMGAGVDDSEAKSNEGPQHTVYLDGFWIDQVEVTNAQYRLCVEVEVCAEPGLQTWDDPDRNAPEQPVVAVTWEDAQTYCQWAGARLPTEAEWEKAARGTQGQVYPWGNDFDASLLNYCDAQCKNASNKDEAHDDGYAQAAPVGSFPEGASWCGALDMSGNVWEWVADWYGDYDSAFAENPQGPDSGEYRVRRGGSFEAAQTYARSTARYAYRPGEVQATLGFRCASASATPEAISEPPVEIEPSWQAFLEGEQLISGAVTGFAEDQTSMLWIGTEAGAQVVDTFDVEGAWETVLQSDEGMASNRIEGLFADPRGGIWFAHDSRKVSFYDGITWVQYSMAEGIPGNVADVAVDSLGRVWFATDGGLAILEEGAISTLTQSDGLPMNYVWALLADGDVMWAGLGSGLLRFEDDQWETVLEGSVLEIAQDTDGSLLLGTSGAVLRFDGSEAAELLEVGKAVTSIAVDLDGNLWVGTAEGLYHFDGQTWSQFTTDDGLPSNQITAVLVDTWGTVWVGGGGIAFFAP